jgi:ABC-2 type transport system ATP-binding protein
MTPLLEVRHLQKHYGRFVALADVNFAVDAGEKFGLLGPNGAGKTTLLSIVSCLLDPTGGEVLLEGQRLRRTDRNLRRQIGIVPQELALYGELTAHENLQFLGQLYGLEHSTLKKRTGEVLELIGLTDRAHQAAHTFSGGMKRRLNLGLGLMHAPRLLLLDEPTTGVDPQSRNHIFEGVRRLNAEGVTIIYTSHYMEEVQALCTRVGIMDHGRLIACDALPNLLQQLAGLIRFRVPHVTQVLRDRSGQLAAVHVRQSDPQTLELECRDIKSTLLGLIGLLTELQIELTSLETEEPNLERVFLHLTGRALRD